MAEEDLRAAELSMEAAPHSAYSLLARAAEKAAKAVLCHEGIRPPKTHSLDALASLLPVDHTWRQPIGDLENISIAAVSAGYPTIEGTPFDLPSAEEMKKSAAEVRKLVSGIRRYLGLSRP
ncbi:HEPN domain-containing protein [Magnetospirillum sp. 15-1]|uniref:HEPN domain-containing protein n=1 Tax=Magnetospirillum sp. 15-1 TaxID=1979370 RepID=UPI001483CA08|nr:HEPN domain-containing protein [Magnetospirillum sp. 15-1]